MARRVSLTYRLAAAAQQSGEVPVTLVEIDHPDHNDPIRLSSDPTHQFSYDPYRRGTRHSDLEYDFILMGAEWPDDEDGVPAAGRLTVENVDSDIAKVLRGFLTPATVTLRCVLASSPDDLEWMESGLEMTVAIIDQQTVALDFSAENIAREQFPYHTMNKQWMPGVHR